MKKIAFFSVLFAIAVIATVSCKKKEEKPEPKDSFLAAQENALAQNLFDDVFKQVDNASRKMDDSCGGTKSAFESLAACATVTITPFDAVTWPKTVTVDFGTTNCMGNDGRTRRGKLIYTVTTWYHDSGCVITVNPQNFYINDHKVEGTKTITNKGRDNDGYLVYQVVVNNALITKPDGNTFTWNTSRMHKWVAGETTILNPWDDVYLITGTANGVASDGGAFSITINTPLDVAVSCKWIRSGTLTLVTEQFPNGIQVDYGNGDCDALATATIQGQTYNFVMN